MKFDPFAAFVAFKEDALCRVFSDGFDFSHYLASHSNMELATLIATTALAFCLVDMFDTIGTLYGACARGDLLTKEGEVPNMEKAMLADAIATTCGAVCGTSTVSTYVESSAGIAEGGKTGLASMVTAALFFISLFLSPVAALVPGCAAAAALIYVGIMMMNCAGQINWLKAEEAVPAFLTLAMMPFTYNISYGIAFGLIAYVFIATFTGKAKKLSLATWVIALLFALMFFVTH